MSRPREKYQQACDESETDLDSHPSNQQKGQIELSSETLHNQIRRHVDHDMRDAEDEQSHVKLDRVQLEIFGEAFDPRITNVNTIEGTQEPGVTLSEILNVLEIAGWSFGYRPPPKLPRDDVRVQFSSNVSVQNRVAPVLRLSNA